ncbi:MAG: HAMP domain-containing histidine kinase [Myxococcota bacterium]|nr:HAMP domain-containing histidine kinase [Myxococcota bacterium]
MTATGQKKLRLRIVQRIYFAGLVQFATVAACIVALSREMQPPHFLVDAVRYVASSLTSQSDSPDALNDAVARVHATLHWSVAVYGDTDELLASAGPVVLPAPSSLATGTQRAFGPAAGPGSVPITLHGGKTGHLVYQLPPPPAVPGLGTTALLVLVVVGVSSWLTARSLGAPFARLVATTNAFGSGDLAARVRMKRSDELGDVANAFDDMADRVTHSIRAERELLANISHELRTPLQRIHIALDLASEGDAATARDSLGEISEDLRELERLVDDVLQAARLALIDGATRSSAVPPARVERIELRGLLEKAAARFRAAHPERALQMVGDEDVVVSGDPLLLRRTIDNLLENAHKYTTDPALPVALSFEADAADAVVIEVRDRGVGISEADLERVFEPFFRADRSRARASGGLGLGLALSRRIVEAHRGRLTLVSAVGYGTTARIELPRVTNDRCAEPPPDSTMTG